MTKSIRIAPAEENSITYIDPDLKFVLFGDDILVDVIDQYEDEENDNETMIMVKPEHMGSREFSIPVSYYVAPTLH